MAVPYDKDGELSLYCFGGDPDDAHDFPFLPEPPQFKTTPPPGDEPLVEHMFGAGPRIVHPCTAFAESAGLKSWSKAVEAMKGGQVVHGRAPCIGRTTIDIDLFNQAVIDAGMRAAYLDFGQVAVGLLDRVEKK